MTLKFCTRMSFLGHMNNCGALWVYIRINMVGFSQQFEIGGTFVIFPYFCTPNVLQHIKGPFIFGGTQHHFEGFVDD